MRVALAHPLSCLASNCRYPQCLAFLEILTNGTAGSLRFIEEMCKPTYQDFVHQQAFYSWQFSGTARLREVAEAPTAAEIERATQILETKATGPSAKPQGTDASEGGAHSSEVGAACWGDGPISRFSEPRISLGRTNDGGVSDVPGK